MADKSEVNRIAAEYMKANPEDIAKIQYALESPDSIRPAGSTRAYVTNKNGQMKPADTVLYEKQNEDGSYYVVQAVPDTKKKTLYVVTAFIGKSGYKNTEAPQSTNANSPGATPAAESAVASNNSINQTVPGVNGENSSAEGQVVRNSDGAAVQIADVESASGGKLRVKLTDGSIADVSELSFPNVGEQELWRVLTEYSDNAEDARQLLKEYRAGDLQAFEYAKGVEEAFLYGKLNISDAEMSQRGSYVNRLNPMQKNMAYKYGQYAGKKQAQRQQEKIDGSKTSKKNKKGQLHYEGDRNKLTERQRASLQTCEIIAKALGIQVHVFESGKNDQGKRVGDNCWYDPKDGSIHIDLYAGENGEGVMAFTMAHELGHFIKDWSPTKFRTLAKFLAEQYGQKGLSVRDMVLLQQKKAEANGRKLTFEQAHEEWVCDSLETMLTDGAVIEKLAMLQAKDTGLVQKIKQFLTEFLGRLKAAYKGVSPQTKEGRIISEMVDAAQELRDLFTDALIDAGENYQSADNNTTGEGGVRYQARYSIKNPNQLDPRTVTREDVRGLLEGAKAGKYAENTYIPVRISTPGIIQERLFAADLPMAMPVKKVIQAFKPDQGKIAGKNVRGHALTVNDMLEIIERLDSPDYLFSQHDGRGIAVLKLSGNTAVVVEFGNNINAPYMNGFEGGKYNISITAFDIDGGNVGLFMMQQDKGWNKVFDKEKEGDPAKKFQATRPFAIEQDSLDANVTQINQAVKENDSTGRRSSSRSGEAVSDRAVLVDMFAQTVTNSKEYKALEYYRKHIQEMQAIEEKLERISAEIRRLSFAEGPRDTETLNRLKLQQKQAVNQLNNYDGILLRLEKSGVLRAMIERSRKQITQESYDRAKEYYRERNERRETELRAHYQESRRKAVERHDLAQVRQQIKKDVAHLDSY